MLNHSNIDDTTYNINDPKYWDRASLYSEMDRVYDICIGCRLCFNLCPSFPSLFDSIDNAGKRKRDIAQSQGIVEKEVERKNYLDLPEGEHASDASIEVEFRGEVSDLTEKERWEVVDLCYQCKLCDPICPYTPDKEHEFQLDFPKLMTRSQAIRTRERGIKISDKFLANTDFTGKMGSLVGPILNMFNNVSIVRLLMEKFIGIHRDRKLPKFHNEKFSVWFKKNKQTILDSKDKVVLFGTCFTDSHDVDLGRAAVAVLNHNDIECIYPKQQCCGAPHLSPGDFDNFRNQAQPNVEELSKWVDNGYKIVVTGPPTCSLTLKKEYPDYLGSDDKIEKISSNTFDISEYLVFLHKNGKLKTDFSNSIGSVTYHVSCHLKAQKIGFKGRDLLRLVPDTKVSLVNRCSGMDGGWGMKEEFFEESINVGDKCVNDISKKESDSVCSDCSLASHQLGQVSDGAVNPTHPIIELYRAYGLHKS